MTHKRGHKTRRRRGGELPEADRKLLEKKAIVSHELGAPVSIDQLKPGISYSLDGKDLGPFSGLTNPRKTRAWFGTNKETYADVGPTTRFVPATTGGKKTRKLPKGAKGFMVRRVCAISLVPVGIKTRRRKH